MPNPPGTHNLNAGPGAALEVQCATGTTTDGFVQVKEHAVEPATVVEGDTLLGASTAECMHMLPGAWRCPGSLLLITSHITWRGIMMQGCVQCQTA